MFRAVCVRCMRAALFFRLRLPAVALRLLGFRPGPPSNLNVNDRGFFVKLKESMCQRG